MLVYILSYRLGQKNNALGESKQPWLRDGAVVGVVHRAVGGVLSQFLAFCFCGV